MRTIGRWRQLLPMIVMILLVPESASAHTGNLEIHAFIVLIAQVIVGPAIIIFAKIFEGQRRRYLIAFFLGAGSSWAVIFFGLHIIEKVFYALTEGLKPSTVGTISAICFYAHFLGIPLIALAVARGADALLGKYRREDQ